MPHDSFDFTAFGSEIAGRMARGMGKGRDAAGVAAAMAEITAFVEATLAGEMDGAERALIACGPGCAACCVVNVTLLLPEAVAITEYLRTAFDAGERGALAAAVGDTARTVRWMDDAERIRRRIPCPFLDRAGWCRIHPVRPLTCRAVTSTDPLACRRALDAAAGDEEEPLLMNLFQKFLVDTAFRGVAEGLARLGRDDRGRELTQAVAALLQAPVANRE
ncbi:YkgJ family cysteine cluster protein [Geobacter sp.]|uniref:YkgJ family cysteine cluster protein n=1 Tax=Geobacter sp. TaxID=46610 RepID=UPI00260B32FE|nr:YkgJ family cysteine cluster protein [Geobacter sp.]